jgi:hypothetical protein
MRWFEHLRQLPAQREHLWCAHACVRAVCVFNNQRQSIARGDNACTRLLTCMKEKSQESSPSSYLALCGACQVEIKSADVYRLVINIADCGCKLEYTE